MSAEQVNEVKISFESIRAQLAEIAASLQGPITPEQWDQVWVDTCIALREDGESEENASVLADHLMCEHFGPRPKESA